MADYGDNWDGQSVTKDWSTTQPHQPGAGTRTRIDPKTGRTLNIGRQGPALPVDREGNPRKPTPYDRY